MVATIPPESGFGQEHGEALRGENRWGNARTVLWREESRVVGKGKAQESTSSLVALVDGEVRYRWMR